MTLELSTRRDSPINNLVSDSVLVEDAINLLRRARNRRMSASLLADRVLQISNLDDDIAASFIAELVRDDARLYLTADHHVQLADYEVMRAALDETDFVVVDVETTGAKTPLHRVTEIGAYRVHQGRIVDEFQTLVNPQQPIPPFIQSLTNITDAMVRRAPDFADIAPTWLAFARRAVLVAHNANFDVRFINSEVERVYPNRRMINPSLCTVHLSRQLIPNLINYRLHTIAEHFQINIRNRHRAAGDALATAQIFLQLLDKMREREVKTLGDVRLMRSRGR